MSDNRNYSVITNFGCHWQCPYCIVRNTGIQIAETRMGATYDTVMDWWDKDKNAVAISYKDNRLILTVDDAQALLRQLEMLLPERPSRDEPEEPGFYRTRTGAFLRKNSNGAWSALFINGDLIPRYWNDQDDYAKWETVLDCLYPRAFPLTPTTAPYPLKGE